MISMYVPSACLGRRGSLRTKGVWAHRYARLTASAGSGDVPFGRHAIVCTMWVSCAPDNRRVRVREGQALYQRHWLFDCALLIAAVAS